ncbi:MAG TPA: class I SAM-dependent methyltransferase [Steroidobacteraceae bacterium]|nr:class I SAM-dependent methyltransferase [Steroidobacteraceae bacterium]HRX90224.1 class I SAM-dependent methyltransferase [Steroidobacteraceae bacterium]
MTTPAVEPDSYVLGRSAEEYRRLVAQARILESATQRALQDAGLTAGQSALDVGCGPCEVMRLMAERVGATGKVTGIDRDAGLGAHALGELRRAGLDMCRFIAADASTLESIAGEPFDLVFARLFLFHVKDPVTLLRRMWRWVRPGGTLLVMDYDLLVAASTPHDPTIERALEMTTEAFRAAGCHVDIGARLPQLFRDAELGHAADFRLNEMHQPAAATTAMLRSLLTSLRDTLVHSGIADSLALHRLDGDLAAAASGSAICRWPDLAACWQRKPLTTPA